MTYYTSKPLVSLTLFNKLKTKLRNRNIYRRIHFYFFASRVHEMMIQHENCVISLDKKKINRFTVAQQQLSLSHN